jgi:hypothetical protein
MNLEASNGFKELKSDLKGYYYTLNKSNNTYFFKLIL